MLTSFSEFKFYQSFRMPVEEADGLRFLIEIEDELGHKQYLEDAKLMDISVTGFGMLTKERVSVGTSVQISLQFKKDHLDLTGSVVRAFSDAVSNDLLIYGVELDEDKKLAKFLENYVMTFSADRLRDCLIKSTREERYTKVSDGFEMFSLLLSLFKDITNFKEREGFIETMLDEVVRILNGSRASVFLINPENNELEAVTATGIDKEYLKFDYRLGVAGSVFTTGVALNIDTQKDKSRFHDDFDHRFGFKTTSVICYPIHNREDKIIGVIEVLNKKNQDRFTVEDEKTMKVLSLVFSSLFHSFDPIDEASMVRRFSTPSARKYALIGKSAHAASLRGAITKIKDLDDPILMYGEAGVGKTLMGIVIHNEGCRGLNPYELVSCKKIEGVDIETAIFGGHGKKSIFEKAKGGTVMLEDVSELTSEQQNRLYKILNSSVDDVNNYHLECRIMATATVDLAELVEHGSFQKELFEILSKIYLHVDALRRRRDDIVDLVDHFMRVECNAQGLLAKTVDAKAMKRLVEYDWPHNVSELKTCISRIVTYNPKEHIVSNEMLDDSALPPFDVDVKKRRFGDLPYVSDFNIPLKDRLAIMEREMIYGEIKRHNGNKTKAATAMGISREALRKKLIASDKVMDNHNSSDIDDAVKKAA